MKIGSNILGDYNLGTNREYLLTNGLGSFSNASINGNHARQYHGLFVTALIPPLDRYMLIHKVEESLNNHNLSTSKQIFGNKTIINEGFKDLLNFEFIDFPKWTYLHNGTFLEKEQFMVFEREILGLKYKTSSKSVINDLKLDFFLNFRDIHKMSKLHEHPNYNLNFHKDMLKISIKEHSFFVKTNGKIVINDNLSIEEYNFEGDLIKTFKKDCIAYDIELGERGDKGLDSSINSFSIESSLKNNEELWILFINEDLEQNSYDFHTLYNTEKFRIQQIKDNVSKNNEFLRDLSQASDNFIVQRSSTKEKTILAGYPWFGDWGRDTMIALPGLTLATGRYSDAESILKTFSKYLNKGMLPNKFPDYDGEDLMYNTIDASLWYFYAVHKYLEYTKNYTFIKNEILHSLEDIIKYHIFGTRYGIKVDEIDGLLMGGDEKTQLTWMDVKYKGVAITPRYGKTVEINALWYNALKIYMNICKDINRTYPEEYEIICKKIENNFTNVFWNIEKNSLYDYISNTEKNSDIRPNQIFVVSLPYELLPKDKAKKVVESCLVNLYTPRGMRSLSNDNQKYIGLYYGSLCSRDSCYHQGTVWSWPLGHFLDAHYKIYNDKKEILLLIEGIKDHFYNDGAIKNINEIFDGNSPHTPRGCYAQAWSVGEILRIYKEIII